MLKTTTSSEQPKYVIIASEDTHIVASEDTRCYPSRCPSVFVHQEYSPEERKKVCTIPLMCFSLPFSIGTYSNFVMNVNQFLERNSYCINVKYTKLCHYARLTDTVTERWIDDGIKCIRFPRNFPLGVSRWDKVLSIYDVNWIVQKYEEYYYTTPDVFKPVLVESFLICCDLRMRCYASITGITEQISGCYRVGFRFNGPNACYLSSM